MWCSIKWNPNRLGLLGAVVLLCAPACGRKEPPLLPCQIQGRGAASAYEGRTITISGLVTADYEEFPLNGFFLQEEPCDPDPGTSNGILVIHDPLISLVNLGDRVQITGEIQEKQGMTVMVADPASLNLISVGHPLPPGRRLPASEKYSSGALPSWEAVEGMLVSVQDLYLVELELQGGVRGKTSRRVSDPHGLVRVRVMGPELVLQLPDQHVLFPDLAAGSWLSGTHGPLQQRGDEYLLWSQGIESVHQPLVMSGGVKLPTPTAADVSLPDPGYRSRDPFFPSSAFIQPGSSLGRLGDQSEIPPSVTPTPLSLPRQLVITEILPNPRGDEPEGEWIEIYNPLRRAQPLTGLKVGDAVSPTGREGMFLFPAGTYIESKEVLVIAHQGVYFHQVYGQYPDFEMVSTTHKVLDMVPDPAWAGSAIQLANSGDEILLLGDHDRVIDAVSYGKSDWEGFQPAAPRPPEGHSLERYPPKKDRDAADDWRVRERVSPGRLDRSQPTPRPSSSPKPTVSPSPSGPTPTPVPGNPLVSEVMADPRGDEPGGEWVELYNPFPFPMPLGGYRLGDAATSGDREGMRGFPPHAVIQPLGTLVIANQGVIFWEQYGFLPDFEILSSHPEVPELHKASGWSSGSFSLRNQGDEVVLLGGADQVLDALAYGDSPFNKTQPPVAQVPEGSSYYRVFDQGSGNGSGDWQEQPNPEPGKANYPPPTSTPTPGKTPQPTLSLTPLPPVQALVISEVLVNPAGDEPGCEWIEIHNLESDTIALSGVRVGDAFHRGDREGMAVFPSGSSLPSGEVLVVAHQAACFRSVYHVLPDYELKETLAQVPALESDTGWSSGSTALSNRGDEVLLLDPWYRVLDLLVYGKTDNPAFDPPVPPPREGCSLERYPPGMDRDQAGDWREAEHPSPGRLSEIQPTLQPSPTRERTPGPEASLTLTPTHHPQPTPIPTQVPSQPAEPTLEFSPTVTLTPSSEPELTLTNTATKSGPSQTPEPSPSSTSAVFTPSPTSLILPTLTPSAEPSPSSTFVFPQMIINEVHADPAQEGGDANGDGVRHADDDEFLELVNISGAEIDLSGWTITDGVGLRYTFNSGAWVPPDCPVVIFGGGQPSGDFGGALIGLTGSLGLNNGGDQVTLLDAGGQVQSQVGYGSEGNRDQSLTRNPDLGGMTWVLHAEADLEDGSLFSPGTRLDGRLFGVCPGGFLP